MIINFENGIGTVRAASLVPGTWLVPGGTRVNVVETDDIDLFKIEVIDDDLESEDDLAWIVSKLRCGEAKLVA